MRARGAALRAQLGIAEHSLLRSRDGRNDLEHFDDRLDTWDQETAHLDNEYDETRERLERVLIDLFDDAISGSVRTEVTTNPRNWLRWIDSRTQTYHFYDNSYDLKDIAAELRDLLEKTRHWRADRA